MDFTIDPAVFLTIGGGAGLITALTEVVKRTAAWSDATVARFASITAIIIGVVVFVAGAFAFAPDSNLAQAFLAGVVSGLTSSGLYNVGGKQVIVAVAGPTQP